MAKWNIRCYVNSSGRNEIFDWYQSQSDSIQAAFDSSLEYLIEQDRSGWVRPKATRLKNDLYKDIYEIRFKADNKQIRPLGFFGPITNSEFTILSCVLEKGGKFEPKNAVAKADERKNDVIREKARYSAKCFCNTANAFCETLGNDRYCKDHDA